MPEATSRPAIDLGRLAPDLRETCGDYCGSYHDELAQAVARGEHGVAIAKRHARILDGLLGALYCAADATSRAEGHPPEGRVALVAVGGYGRGMVGLHSDIDVLFVCDDPQDRHVALLAEGLLYPLWDLGLEIGHAVRGVEETVALAKGDLRTATTLLDMRRIAGDKQILSDLLRLGRSRVFEVGLESFLDQLGEDRASRHERYGGSLYLLEPEVKSGCGGLRDLDLAGWAAKARWNVEDTDGLVKHGALLSREVDELSAAREMLWRTRNLLHLRAGRRQDRLTFEDQEEIAVQLGFIDGVTLGVEQFMQAYYRHAKVVEQTSERMLARARERHGSRSVRTEPIDEHVLLFGDTVTFRDSARLEDEPGLALRLYDVARERGLAPYSFAREAIARATNEPAWGERLRQDPEAARRFIAALRGGPIAHGRRSLLGELHELGVLLAMIPEFGPVTGRVQHDVYHVYTVDVHSVAAVDRLAAIKRGDFINELPLASRLAAELPRPDPLFLGLLLHDIGKAHGKDHSRTGALMARPIAERLGLSPVDVAHVVWLVEAHLRLYHWATRRDTTDPDVIAEVAREVETIDRLRDLYLLTVADLSTTNPKAMTSWKARMLEDLYLATARELELGGSGGAARRADAIRDEACAGFVDDPDREELDRFLVQMPDRYLLANPVDAIRDHARACVARKGDPLLLRVRPGSSADVSELVVVTDDRPGLLAQVGAALAGLRLSVVTAQVYTRTRADGRDEAVDVFEVRHVASGADGAPLAPERLARLEKDLRGLLDGSVQADDLL
ncbi:MAG: [protein-PII] uridylyltransferase, partial [Sandaracinaceae bacterium]